MWDSAGMVMMNTKGLALQSSSPLFVGVKTSNFKTKKYKNKK